VLNLQRMFNVREGITPKDDCLPKRIFSIPEFGKYSTEPDCVIKDFDALMAEYYDARGWDPISGSPKTEKLVELGLA
jgi:aldehyde:ferredoxin oxidoreductase